MGLWAMACCGGVDAEGRTPVDERPATPIDSRDESGFSAQSTVGGMDQHAVRAAVREVMRQVDRCIDQGRKELPFLGGNVEIFVRVNSSGRATVAFAERSTLGDHQVENCVVEAFRSRQWPRPVGGKVGEIRQGFDYTAGHHGQPLDWSETTLASAMATEADGGPSPFDELVSKLSDCRREAATGRLTVTMYLDEDGLARAVGAGMSDPKGRAAVDCLVTTVQTTSFPSPEGNFVKVTVQVP